MNTRRTGSTLVEVLVAIFIMGIGLMALLTLFPLGALRMAQAIRVDRCTHAAYNAEAISIIHNIRNDLDVVSAPFDANGPIPDMFVNPYPRLPNGLPGLIDADPMRESYGIFADPLAYYSSPTNTAAQDWVGGYTGLLRRRPLEFVRRNAPVANPLPTVKRNIIRSCTLWDDMNFDRTLNAGAPQNVGTAIHREARFSWAYLLHRPQTSDRSVVDCHVVVFERRPTSLTGTLAFPEYVYPLTYYDTTRNTITIDSTSNVPPPLRPGGWILDVTRYYVLPNGIKTTNPPAPIPTGTTVTNHAYFHRVLAVTQLTDDITQYEVQDPLRGFTDSADVTPDPLIISPNGLGFLGTSIVLEGVAEVFPKGPARAP